LAPRVIDSVKLPVCRFGEFVVLTRMRYGPRLGNARTIRDEQPGPPSSLMMELSRSSPRTINTGSKSSEERSSVIVSLGPGAVN